MNDMVIKAIIFATEKHKGQERRSTGLPYVTHPIIVSHLLEKYKSYKNKDILKAAALLHDTLEDTNTSFQEISTTFSPMIAGIVLELTSDKNEIKKIGKNEYLKIKLTGMSNYSLIIKLCDRLSNIIDNPSKKYVIDTIELLKYLEEKRKLSKTQLKIIKEIFQNCNEFLVKEV